MRFHSVYSSVTGQYSGRAVWITSVVLLLLLAVPPHLSANSISSSGNETLPDVSMPATLSAPEGNYPNGFEEGANSKESLIRKGIFDNNSSSQAGTPAPSAETAAGESSVISTVKLTPDWDGIWRDTGVIVGLQFVAVAFTYVMPESFSSWTPEQKKNGFRKYSRNVGNPVMDKDAAYINYGLHPYWGSTYYIRGRERGLDQTSSFIYSIALSALYEFGVEALAEKPSIQDLIATPVLGSLLGAYIVEPWRESIRRKQELKWYDHTVLVLTDPLGVLSSGVEKIFGVKSTIRVDYSSPQILNSSNGIAAASKGNRIGVALQFPLN